MTPRRLLILVLVVLVVLAVTAAHAKRKKAQATRFPTRRPTQFPTKKVTSKPSKVVSASPSSPAIAGSCTGEPCADPTMCRSSSNFCGGNVGGSDPWCNDQSTWKSTGCGLLSSTKSPSSTNAPFGTTAPTPKVPTTKSPTSKAPTSKSPTSKAPTSKSPTPKVPTTKSPTSKAPTTKSPTSKAPTSKSPTTKSPVPVGETPSTKSPVSNTIAPSSLRPTTKSPSTLAPIVSGNGCTGLPCDISTQCRSQWGYCGGSVTGPVDDYCNSLSTWKSIGCGTGTKSPTQAPVPTSPTPPTTRSPTGSADELVANVVSRKAGSINTQLLLYQTPQSTWVQSTMYIAADLLKGVQAATTGFAGLSFIAEGAQGKLSLAAFLAQAMKESISYDVCDENNWDLVGSIYPASNACGQLSQSYQDYTCSAAEKVMECPLNSSMSATARTNAKWYGAPAPLYGGPKSTTGNLSPGWDYSAQCAGGTCSVYPGQQAGAWKAGPAANRAGRTDLENCVWWGRGAIQLTGRCNFGKLNYFLGKGAFDRGVAAALFPDVDFCRDPSAICQSIKYPELKWVSGLFYWMRDVQEFNEGGWNYRTKLADLAADPTNSAKRKSFIDGVSGIVNRGSPTITADGVADRSANFEKAYTIMFS